MTEITNFAGDETIVEENFLQVPTRHDLRDGASWDNMKYGHSV